MSKIIRDCTFILVVIILLLFFSNNYVYAEGTGGAAGTNVGWTSLNIPSVPFASLPATPVNNQIFIVTDGTPGTPCTGGGHGAIAYGVGGAWGCRTIQGTNESGYFFDGTDSISSTNINGKSVATAWGLPTRIFAKTTATTTSSSPTVTVASASGLAVNHWMTIAGAGPVCGSVWNQANPNPSYTCAALANEAISQLGTTGSSTTSYTLCNTDGLGGINHSCSAVSVSNSPSGGPSYASPISLTTTFSSTEPACVAIWRTSDGIGPGGIGYIGTWCHQVFIDVGYTPIANDLLMPSAPPLTADVNDAWRFPIGMIVGTTITPKDGSTATVTVTGKAAFTDDSGAIQKAVFTANNAACGTQSTGYCTAEIPGLIWNVATPIITGPSVQGLRITCSGAQLDMNQYSGFSLVIGDASFPGSGANALRTMIDGCEFVGTGGTDTTHPQQNAIYIGTTNSQVLRDVTILNVPGIGIAGDKGGVSGQTGAWLDERWQNVRVQNAGHECVLVGRGHLADALDVIGSKFADCGQQLTSSVTDTVTGFSDGGVYFGVGNPTLVGNSIDGMAYSGQALGTSSSTGYCNALEVESAGGGSIIGNHFEVDGCGTTSVRLGQHIRLKSSQGLLVSGNDFNNQTGPNNTDVILAGTGTTNNHFIGNHIDGPSSGSVLYSILIGAFIGNTVDGYSITGDAPTHFTSITGAGIGANTVFCKGTATLVSGVGTLTSQCITAGSICKPMDVTTFANAVTLAAPTEGSVNITGTGSDVVSVTCS